MVHTGSALRDRMERNSMPEPNSGCWLWLGTLSGGYGKIDTNGHGTNVAHRINYEHFIGPIPDGLTLDHKCRTKCCVNPFHLEPVTAAENTRRHYRLQTHCKRGHPLTPGNLYAHKEERRQCATCVRESINRRRAEQKALGEKRAY